jgi:hypothetical protein
MTREKLLKEYMVKINSGINRESIPINTQQRVAQILPGFGNRIIQAFQDYFTRSDKGNDAEHDDRHYDIGCPFLFWRNTGFSDFQAKKYGF